jgi:copper chaperone NosL
VAILIAAGLLVALSGRRRLLYAWTAIFLAGAIAGLADFWRWGYDYGHDLSPTAAIKIPDMTYQPPLIGTKQLLNFEAASWPALGGWIAIAALVLAGLLTLREWRRGRSALVAGAAVLAAACGAPAPRPLAFGAETCTQCHMTLADPRYAAELVLTTGRVVPFDDPGCLADWLVETGLPAARVHSAWVSGFLPPHELLDVRSAVFLRSDSLRSPMNHGLAALPPGPAADSLRAALGGALLSWDQVLAEVRGQEETGREAP